MSENDSQGTIEEPIPIDLTQPVVPETEAEATKEPEVSVDEPPAKPELPEWSKPLQKMQERLANNEKATSQKLDQLMELMKSAAKSGTANQQQTRIERAMSFLESDKGRDIEAINPGITGMFKDMLEEVRELRSSGDNSELRKELAEVKAEAFWSAYPPDARTFVEAEGRRLQSELGLQGEALQGALKLVLNTYIAEKSRPDTKTATKIPAKAASSKGQAIQATGARTSTKGDSPEELLKKSFEGTIDLMGGTAG